MHPTTRFSPCRVHEALRNARGIRVALGLMDRGSCVAHACIPLRSMHPTAVGRQFGLQFRQSFRQPRDRRGELGDGRLLVLHHPVPAVPLVDVDHLVARQLMDPEIPRFQHRELQRPLRCRVEMSRTGVPRLHILVDLDIFDRHAVQLLPLGIKLRPLPLHRHRLTAPLPFFHRQLLLMPEENLLLLNRHAEPSPADHLPPVLRQRHPEPEAIFFDRPVDRRLRRLQLFGDLPLVHSLGRKLKGPPVPLDRHFGKLGQNLRLGSDKRLRPVVGDRGGVLALGFFHVLGFDRHGKAPGKRGNCRL